MSLQACLTGTDTEGDRGSGAEWERNREQEVMVAQRVHLRPYHFYSDKVHFSNSRSSAVCGPGYIWHPFMHRSKNLIENDPATNTHLHSFNTHDQTLTNKWSGKLWFLNKNNKQMKITQMRWFLMHYFFSRTHKLFSRTHKLFEPQAQLQ